MHTPEACVFGQVVDGKMELNVYGEIVRDEWLRTPKVRTNVIMDEFVVMPNHIHAILMLESDANVGATRQVAPTGTLQSGSLGAIICQFKSLATKRIHIHRLEHDLTRVQVWQRNYYERITRDEKELNEVRRYIQDNPVRWSKNEGA